MAIEARAEPAGSRDQQRFDIELFLLAVPKRRRESNTAIVLLHIFDAGAGLDSDAGPRFPLRLRADGRCRWTINRARRWPFRLP